MLHLLLIGDLHYKYCKDSSESNVKELTQLHSKLIEICTHLKSQNRLDKIILLGDTLDAHARMHISQHTRASKLIIDLIKIAPIVVLIGNHDRINPREFLTDESPFYLLRLSPDAILADTVMTDEVKGYKMIYVPYVSPGRFIEAIETKVKDWKQYNLIFAHQEFKGSVDNDGFESVEGDEWSIEYPPIYTGHIHQYSKLSNGVTNVGTPYQTRFGECLTKHILLLEIGDTINEVYIDTGIRKKLVRKVNIDDLPNLNVKEFDNQNIYKLVIVCEREEGKKLKKLKLVKELNKRKNVMIKYQYIEKNIVNEISLDRTFDTKDNFFTELESVLADDRQKMWMRKLLN